MEQTTIVALRNNNSLSRKIFFYEIVGFDENGNEMKFSYYDKLVNELKTNLTKYDSNDTNKCKDHTIKSITINDEETRIVLRYCKYNFMPDIYDITTKGSKSSIKTSSEGDEEKTHVIINGNVIKYENRRNGTPINVFFKFLQEAWNSVVENDQTVEIKSIRLNKILVNDVISIIKECKKIRRFNVQYFRSYNDPFLEEYDDIECAKYDLSLVAERNKSLNIAAIIGKIEKLFASKDVAKVTVDIVNEENENQIINLNSFSKTNVIYCDRDSNGSINSSDIFLKMSELK